MPIQFSNFFDGTYGLSRWADTFLSIWLKSFCVCRFNMVFDRLQNHPRRQVYNLFYKNSFIRTASLMFATKVELRTMSLKSDEEKKVHVKEKNKKFKKKRRKKLS